MLVFVFSAAIFAGTDWLGPTGNWNNNRWGWETSTPPNLLENAQINTGMGNYPIIDSTVSATVVEAYIGFWGDGRVDMTGGSLSTGSALACGTAGGYYGEFNMSGGTAVIAGHVYIGLDGAQSGAINMSGDSSMTLNTLVMAHNATTNSMLLNLSDNAIISMADLWIDQNNGGLVTISDNAQFIVNGDKTSLIADLDYLEKMVAGAGQALAWDYDITNPGKTTIAIKHLDKAYAPNPADGAIDVESNVILSWKTCPGTISQNIFIGENYAEVLNAQPFYGDLNGDSFVDIYDVCILGQQWLNNLLPAMSVSSDFNDDNIVDFDDFSCVSELWGQRSNGVFKGHLGQSIENFEVFGLELGLTQSWRVDQVLAGGAVAGDVWQFSVKPALSDLLEFNSWCVTDYHTASGNLTPDADGNVLSANLRAFQNSSDVNGVYLYECEIESTVAQDRAVGLKLVLPINCDGWVWHDDAVSSRVISGDTTFSNAVDGINGTAVNVSKYPLMVIENENANMAICIAVPPRPARPVKFVYDNVTHELRAEFDFGLSMDSDEYPGKADAAVIIFEVPSGWSFRRALDRYFDIYDSILHRRSGQGGTLITKSNPSGITNPEDFHFAWHDLADNVYSWASSDETIGIKSFIYREPQSGWRNLRKSYSSTDNITFDDGTSGILVSSGTVTFSDGHVTLSPGASLTIPGYPTGEPEELVAEFTILNYDEFASLGSYEVGFYHRFLCGIRKTFATGNQPKLGTFDYLTDGWQDGELVGDVNRITIRMIADISSVNSKTYVQAAYDTNSRVGATEPLLHLTGTFPWGSWSAESNTQLVITNWVNHPVVIDDVIIKRYSGVVPERIHENYVTQLQEDANNGVGDAQADLLCVVKTTLDDYDLYLGSIDWTNLAPFSINPSPNIFSDKWLNKAQYEFFILGRLLGWYGTATKFDGVFFDSMEGWTERKDYDRSHWHASKYPLFIDRENNMQTCMLNYWNMVAYTDMLADQLHAENQLLMGNGAWYYLWWHMGNVDVPGREVTVLDNGAWSPPSDATYMHFRSLAGKRPFWTLMNDSFDDVLIVEKYFQHSLFYGIFPSMFHAHTGTSAAYFEQPTLYNRDRALFQKYVPLIQELDNAGWESVPWAWTDVAAVRVERFGSAVTSNLHYTLWNTTDSSQSVNLTISKSNVGLDSTNSGWEEISANAVEIVSQDADQIKFKLLLPANGYADIKVNN